MKKHDASCINLGHEKVDMGSLQAANNRALCTKQRNQHIEEANAAFSRESETRQWTATSSCETEAQSEQVTTSSCGNKTQAILAWVSKI